MSQREIVVKARALKKSVDHDLLVKMRKKWKQDSNNLSLPSHRRVFSKLSPDLYQKVLATASSCYPESGRLSSQAATSVFKYILSKKKPRSCPNCDERFMFGAYCSLSCSSKHAAYSEEAVAKRKRTNLRRYGVENPGCSKVLQERVSKTKAKQFGSREKYIEHWKAKMEATSLQRHGVKNSGGTEESMQKAQATWKKNYGSVEAKYEQQFEKSKQTCLDRYGVEYSTQTEQMKAASVATNLRKHGVEHHLQDPKLFAQRMKSMYRTRSLRFSDGKIRTVQSRDEQLVVRVYLRNSFTCGAPDFFIRYSLDGKRRVYHPDFIMCKNGKKFLVEVKSTYTLYKNWDMNIEKFKAANRYCEENEMTFVLVLIRKVTGTDQQTVERLANPTKRKIREFIKAIK